MYIHKIFKLKNKATIDVSILIEEETKPHRKKEYVKKILSKIQFNKEIGYAGFSNQRGIESFLFWPIYGEKYEINAIKDKSCIGFFLEEIKRIIKLGLYYVRFEGTINLFIFPTFVNFIIKRMNGVMGFTPWKNTILVNFFPAFGWKEAFKKTIAHELAHAISLNYTKRASLGDDLVYEGIAEHFRECLIGGKKAKWVKSITKSQAISIYENIKKSLYSSDEELFREVFYGTGRYPRWSGYAVGYHLVDSYLKKQKKIDWRKILRTSPKKIIIESSFK